MTKPRDPEALLTAYLADGDGVLPDRVVDSVLDEVHRPVSGPCPPVAARPLPGRPSPPRWPSPWSCSGCALRVPARQARRRRSEPDAQSKRSPKPACRHRADRLAATERRGVTFTGRPERQLKWTKVELDRPRRGSPGSATDSSSATGHRCGLHLRGRRRTGPRFSLATQTRAMSTCSGGPSRPGRTPPSGGGTPRIVRVPTMPEQPPITARDIFRIVRPPTRPHRLRPSRAGSSRSASDRGYRRPNLFPARLGRLGQHKPGCRTNNEWVSTWRVSISEW